MNYIITISGAAEKEAHNAFIWYEDQKENLGTSFETYFTNAINSIQNNPLKTQIRYNSTRVFFLKKFPYGIHFNVTNNNILIVAVFHTSQNPTNWKKR